MLDSKVIQWGEGAVRLAPEALGVLEERRVLRTVHDELLGHAAAQHARTAEAANRLARLVAERELTARHLGTKAAGEAGATDAARAAADGEQVIIVAHVCVSCDFPDSCSTSVV